MDSSKKPVSLKFLADHLGLSPTTVSLVLNNSARASSIPQHTRERVLEAARTFSYRPNFFAKYLTNKRSYTIAVIVPEISEGYGASILAAIERRMAREGYFYFVASHSWSAEQIEETPRLLVQRGVEGFILVNMPLEHSLPVPVVNIGGRKKLPGVSNMLLDNRRAGRLALEHLAKLGHERIAFFKGHPGSADTEDRWLGIHEAASNLGIEIGAKLTLQLKRHSFPPEPPIPEEGYMYAQKLLARREEFTALFAFNDISAIGAMSAFRDANLRVPEDVSIIGFDDIQAAAFMNPPLTTIRQPLQNMGDLAAKTLLRRIQGNVTEPEDIFVTPELVIRESTAPPPTSKRRATRRAQA
ncbi:MAG TPA: LacI family DNA-binding transcriptional regulator [Candidatus Acidoferrales bacterium]|nr:LacI family DNA-binding transcriptional regulator [Candidatus Acidoferrales bacterium]